MYKLVTGDVDNSRQLAALEDNMRLKEKIFKVYNNNAELVLDFIFEDKITDKKYDGLVSALSLGDEFTIPISQNVANLAFFILVANKANYNTKDSSFMKIRNVTQGRALYELYEGDYSKINIQLGDTPKNPRFKRFSAMHKCLFRENNIDWEIPISFFQKDGKQYCTLGGMQWATFAYATINGTKVKIPRSLWMKFYQNSIEKGQVICEDTDEIELHFNEAVVEPVLEVLKYAGYNPTYKIKVQQDCQYFYDTDTPGLCVKPLTINAKPFEEDESFRWNKEGNIYRFLGKGASYIPTRPLGEDRLMYIFM